MPQDSSDAEQRRGTDSATHRGVRKHRPLWTVSATMLFVLAGWLGVQGYQRWNQGMASFQVLPPMDLAVELIDESDGTVLRRIAAPTSEAIALASGDYTARLFTAGQALEPFQMLVPRGRITTFQLAPFANDLWRTPTLAEGDWTLRMQNGQPVVLHRNRTELRLDEGATGRTRWLSQPKLETGAPGRHSQPKTLDRFSLAQQLVDLNADGIDDLVFYSPPFINISPYSLCAVCGATGQLLWRKRAPVAVQEPDPTKWFRYNEPQNAYQPVLADADGDGNMDLITRFYRSADQQYDVPSKDWLEAISGTSGETIWTYELQHQAPAGIPAGPETIHQQERLRQPQLTEFEGEAVVAVSVDTRVIGLKAASGDLAWEPVQLGASLLRPLRFSSLGQQPGATDVLAALADVDPRQPERATAYLASWSLRSGNQRWRTAPVERPIDWFYGTSSLYGPNGPPTSRSLMKDQGQLVQQDWPLLVDMNSDGKAEILTPMSRVDGATTIGLLDASSGQHLWIAGSDAERFTYLSGRTETDLNGDGWTDLVLILEDLGVYSSKNDSVFMAISGKTGEVLRRWDVPEEVIDTRTGAMKYRWLVRLDRRDQYGWPLCALSTPGSVRIFGSFSGELVHSLSAEHSWRNGGYIELAVADMDKDGFPELLRARPGELRATPIAGKEIWRRIGSWQPAEDYDGDGIGDLISEPVASQLLESNHFLGCVAGADGRMLWQHTTTALQANALAESSGDLNQDQVPDIVLFDQDLVVHGDEKPRPFTVTALSGADGGRLWSTLVRDPRVVLPRQIAMAGVQTFQVLASPDADGDGVAEIYIDFQQTPQNREDPSDAETPSRCLVCLSGRSGKTLWQKELPRPPRLYPADLDGDGLQDVLFSRPRLVRATGNGPMQHQLVAIRGRDGQQLWSRDYGYKRTTSETHGVWEKEPPFGIAKPARGRTAEVVLFDRASREVMALDAASGRVIWTREIPNAVSDASYGPVISLTDANRDRDREICLWVVCASGQKAGPGQRTKPRFFLLDADGQLLADAEDESHSEVLRMKHADLDGDGDDELLVLGRRALRMFQNGFSDSAWQFAVSHPPSAGDLGFDFQIRPGDDGEPPEVIVWGESPRSWSYGLDGRTGQTLWTLQHPLRRTKTRLMGRTGEIPGYITSSTNRTTASIVYRLGWPTTQEPQEPVAAE